ncbi:eukaryotic translation initiation factor 2B subunit delta isoform X2 [Lasioglossum baleicum]|uniref:eukaryotic translation initiation factor 2B subunit delta isoform X2 n=1 Tax=Lasioglossum baleicum TaxID=434251 RepID=UPI003FCE6445
MMDQEEHLTESKSKSRTRSRARRLRRKRLHDARRAEKQQDCLFNGLEVESYCDNSVSVNGTVGNREVTVEKDTENVQTTTESEADRLKKKNNDKLGESIYPYNSYPNTFSPNDSILKCIRSGYRNPLSIYDNLKNLSESDRNIWTIIDTFEFVRANCLYNKMSSTEKTREEVKNDRAAKKAAKALAKSKAKADKVQNNESSSTKPASADSTTDKQTVETSKIVPSNNVQNTIPTTHITSSTSTKSTSIEVTAEGKSKAELRAERRAKQEAQRAAKQQLVQDKIPVKTKQTEETKARVVQQTTAPIESAKKPATPKKPASPKKTIPKENTHEISLFKHLYHEREQAAVDGLSVNSPIHPAIVRLGAQYAQKVIVGSNARCVALLAAVKQLILDFERPSQADFIRGLEASLIESMAYLHYCRPSAVSMQNALRHLMRQMTQLPSALSDADAKSKLRNVIDTYIREQIQLADDAISLTIQRKVSNGDVILTYGYSSLIHKILLDAHTAEKQFRVIVVDGRPWLEGKEQLRRLAKHGIECSYVLISALSYVMPEVSKVFLGAHAILANGAVMSRAGSAQVALMARAFNIPVLVACETHKSHERVQTDSIVYNELGNADELAQGCGSKKCQLTNWKTKKFLNLLNIMYDVTPADLVTAVVTELAILPCTSVPVILRIKPSEI